MIRSGRPGKVYRAVHGRNANGDPVDANGKVVRPEASGTYVGDLKGILMGGISASVSMSRQESSDTTGQIGIPNENPVRAQFGDRILIDGQMYKVTSPDRWNYPNSMSSTKPMYTWVNVEATVG